MCKCCEELREQVRQLERLLRPEEAATLAGKYGLKRRGHLRVLALLERREMLNWEAVTYAAANRPTWELVSSRKYADVTISTMRKIMVANGAKARIVTVRGFGVKLEID